MADVPQIDRLRCDLMEFPSLSWDDGRCSWWVGHRRTDERWLVTRPILEDRDVEALLGVVAVLAEHCTIDEFRQRTVETIPTVVASMVTAWNEVDPTSHQMTNPAIWPPPSMLVGGSFEAGWAIFAAYAGQHPVLQHNIRTADGRPHAISDFYSQEQFRNTALYREFYGPMGVEDQLVLQLPSPSLVVTLTLKGEWQQSSARDRMMLNLLRPHVVQGLRNAYATERLQRLLRAMEQRIESAGEGLVLIDEHDRVDYVSPNARMILARWLGEWRGPVLPGRLSDWVRHQDNPRRPKAPPWPLTLRRDGRQLTIRRLPLPHDTGAALLVTERDLEGNVFALLARLGLTPRQAQVLDLAVEGATNTQIAIKLGITTNTVETHMTKALGKLGAGTRTGAANLIHQALNDHAGKASDL
jgi:DNA-binding CsgD family transcriptional regulator